MHARAEIVRDTAKRALPERLGILAGGGQMPAILAAHMQSLGVRPYLIRLAPYCLDPALTAYEGIDVPMDKVGRMFESLQEQNIRDIVLIGHVRRPKLLSLRPDFTTLKILPCILGALLFSGDDALLRAVRRMLERYGFTLRGAHELMADLLAPEGVMGAHAPGQQGLADIETGWNAALAHGAADKGQAIVVQRGMILDVEGKAGTDALIRHAGTLRVPGGAAPVLIKTVKPQQDMLLDLPTVGPDTIQNCADAFFAGIAIEAGGVLMVERERMIALADQLGLFILGRR